MARSILVLATVLTVSAYLGTDARAQDSGFGLGLIVGDPNGVSLKGYLSDGLTIDGAVGFSLLDGDALAGHADILWEWNITSFDRAVFDWYAGVGPKFAFFFDADTFFLGARGAVGLDFKFTNVPIDVFVEFAPALWLIDDVDFDWDAAAGARYFF